MQSQNLSNKTQTNLSLYYKIVNDKIFKEKRFVDLMNILLKNDNLYKYKYAFYTDSFLLRSNLFIPNFHTMYLSSGNHNVIIEDTDDLWLLDTFKHNIYYIIEDPKDNFDYESKSVKKIKSIKDIV
jgi:hypothetical protein